MKKSIFIICTLFLLMCGVGCAALSYIITPADIDKNAVVYASRAGTADPKDFKGYANLDKAMKLEKAVNEAHAVIQFGLQQKIEQDNLEYGIHKEATSISVASGLQREEKLFGPQGLLSLGLSLAGFGSLTGFIGLMRRRPGDVTGAEMQEAVSKVSGELSVKEKEFIQLVKGIEEFIKTYEDKDKNTVESLKQTLASKQDTDTVRAVAVARKA